MLNPERTTYQMALKRLEIFKSQNRETGGFDVTFEIDGKKLYAHQFILWSLSDPLRILFSEWWIPKKDEPIKLSGYSYDDYYQFLTFLYCGACELTEENIFRITDMAENYDVKELKEFVEPYLVGARLSSTSRSKNITTPIGGAFTSAAGSPPQSMIDIPKRTSSLDSGMTGRATTSSAGSGKINYVVEELKTTENTYVRELREIIEYYIKPFDAPENQNQFPAQLRGQSKTIFGNIRTLYKFHKRLSSLFNSTDSIVEICHLIIDRRRDFLSLYQPYCQNKPFSEATRSEHNIESMKFFIDCQQRANHLLPLSAYLLKPIQRVTKYQLLLKELLRYSPDEIRKDVTAALAAMLDLLSQLNAELNQLHISAFPGDLHLLGSLRLQTECLVYSFKRKTYRYSNKPQRRYLFLFDGGVIFCKKRTQPLPHAPEYYEHKMFIPMKDLGFYETSKSASERFEIFNGTKTEGYAIQPLEDAAKAQWVQRLIKLTTEIGHYHHPQNIKQDQQFISSSGHSHSTSSSSSRPPSWNFDGSVSSRGSGGYADMFASRSSNIQATDRTYSDVDNRYGTFHATAIQIAQNHSSNHGILDSIASMVPNSSIYSLNAILGSQNRLIAK